MTYLLLQTFLLLLASYFLGAFVACVAKRAIYRSEAEVPAYGFAPDDVEAPLRPPIVMPPQPVRPRPVPLQPVAPRAIDPVQPKIEVLRRPEPRPAPQVLDPSRFERALIGPDPNEGVPRMAIVEIRPSVLKPVTDVYRPRPPEPAPEDVPPPSFDEQAPEIPVADETAAQDEFEAPISEVPKTEPRRGGLAARLRDATTAAAAGAVAAAKAAAAASVVPAMTYSRRARIESEDEKQVTEADVAEHPDNSTADADVGFDTAETSGEERPVAVDDEPSDDMRIEGQPEPEEPAAVPEILQGPDSESARAPEPQPVASPKEAVPIVAIEGGDDFQRIRAIDADIEQRLKARGVTYFEHIAAWTASDVKRFGQDLGIPGRIDREQWIEQAQILAKGGETYYSRNRRTALNAAAPAARKAGESQQTGPLNQSASVPQTSVPSSGNADVKALSGVAAANQGRSVAEMAAAAAASIAAASASVTRGLKPIEPISPLSKVDPKISMPARITDAIRDKEASSATTTVEIAKEGAAPDTSTGDAQDDLKRIRGVGVLIEKRLNAMGIRRYEQVANWTSGDIDRVSRVLEFKGRIERESWVEQARILASGGQTEFSRRVDRGEVDTSRET